MAVRTAIRTFENTEREDLLAVCRPAIFISDVDLKTRPDNARAGALLVPPGPGKLLSAVFSCSAFVGVSGASRGSAPGAAFFPSVCFCRRRAIEAWATIISGGERSVSDLVAQLVGDGAWIVGALAESLSSVFTQAPSFLPL